MITAAFIISGLVLLVLGGDWLVKGSSSLALRFGIPSIIVGLTVVAFGTSAPELAVSLNASFKGSADIAVGNVIGSNIFNVLLILGLSALFAPLIIHDQIIKREVPVMIAVSLLALGFAWDGRVSNVEGSLFCLLFFSYVGWLVRSALKARQAQSDPPASESAQQSATGLEPKPGLWLAIVLIASGLVTVVVGADLLVRGATDLAKTLGVSDAIIGLTIVAGGTSLPELSASVMAALRKERDIAVGNIVGSNIFNLLLILGLTSAITPGGLKVAAPLIQFDFPVMVVVAVACFPMFYPGKILTRAKAVIFLSGYIVYTAYLISVSA